MVELVIIAIVGYISEFGHEVPVEKSSTIGGKWFFNHPLRPTLPTLEEWGFIFHE